MMRLLKLLLVMVIWSGLLLGLYVLFLKQPLDNYRTAQAWPAVGVYRTAQPAQLTQVEFLAKLVSTEPLDIITPEAGVLKKWLLQPGQAIEANEAIITLNQSAEKWQKQLDHTPWQLGQLDALDHPKVNTLTATEKETEADAETELATQAIKATQHDSVLALDEKPTSITLVRQQHQLLVPIAGVITEAIAPVGQAMQALEVVGKFSPYAIKTAQATITNAKDCQRLHVDQNASIALSRGLYPLELKAKLTQLTHNKDFSRCQATITFEADSKRLSFIPEQEFSVRVNAPIFQPLQLPISAVFQVGNQATVYQLTPANAIGGYHIKPIAVQIETIEQGNVVIKSGLSPQAIVLMRAQEGQGLMKTNPNGIFRLYYATTLLDR